MAHPDFPPGASPAAPPVKEGGKAAQPTKEGTKFKRNIFINEATHTGTHTVTEGARKGAREKGLTERYVEFDDKLQERYERFLDNHLSGLVRLRDFPDPANPGRTLYDTILSNPNHAVDKELVNLLSSESLDERGEVVGVTIDEAKIKRYLERPDGWITTTQLLEEKTALTLSAAGLHAAQLPPGERHTMIDPMRIRLNVNQGVLNRAWHDRVQPNLPGIGMTIGGIANSVFLGVAGYVQEGPLGGVVGALVTPAVFGAMRAGQSLAREGVVLDLQQCQAAFKVINNDPAERAYVKEVMGIDTRDMVISATTNRIEPHPNRIAETTVAVDTLLSDALGGIYDRQDFYKSLGVPADRLDALPEQFLYNFTEGRQEQTGAHWQADIQREFNPNEGGVRDAAGQNRRLPGNVYNPAFNENNLDFEGNIRRFIAARRRVMAKQMADFARKQLARPDSVREAKNNAVITTLADRRKALEPEGALRKAQEAGIQKIKSALEGDNVALGEEKTPLEKYQKDINDLQEARNALGRELGTISLGGPVTDVDVALRGLRSLNAPATSVTIGGTRLITSIYDTELALKNEISTAYAGIAVTRRPQETDESYNKKVIKAEEAVDAKYSDRVTALEEEKRIVKELSDKLIELRKTIGDKQKALGEIEPSVIAVRQNIDRLQTEFTTIAGWDTIGGVSLTENDLRTEDVGEIIKRINAVRVANVTAGWSENETNRPDIRMRVVRAIIEARARALELAIAAPGIPFVELTNPTRGNISENQLLTLTPNELNALVAVREAAGLITVPPPPAFPMALTGAEIQEVVQIAQRQLEARLSATEQQARQTTEQIQEQALRLSEVDLTQQAQSLEVTEDLLKRYGHINEAADDIVVHAGEYTNSIPVAADREYSAQEKTLAAPRGYYELVNALFDYKNNATRGEYFQKIQRVLPPARLAELLNANLDLGIGAPDMANVLAEMETRMDPANRQISPSDLRRGFRGMMYTLRNEGLAIAA